MAQNVKKVTSKNLKKPKFAENSKSCQNSKKLPKISKVAEKLPSNLWLILTEARRHGGTEARRHGGTEARRHGGTEARRHGGTEARRHGGTEARRHGGTEARRHGGTKTRRHGGREARGHGDTEAWRNIGMEGYIRKKKIGCMV